MTPTSKLRRGRHHRRGTLHATLPWLSLALMACSLEASQSDSDAPDNLDEVADEEPLELDDKGLQYRHEAEQRTAQVRCSATTSFSGGLGTGFVICAGFGSWIEWNNITVPRPGNYQLRARYAATSARPSAVIVNGRNVGNLPFVSTGSPTAWKFNRITVPLQAGRNSVRIIASTAAGGPLLDRVAFRPVPPRTAPAPTPQTCNFRKTVTGTLIGDVTISYTGPIYDISANPAEGGVDVSARCLARMNAWRARENLPPYTLAPLTHEQKCCLMAEAKIAVDRDRGHFMARCVPQIQEQAAGGFPGGTRVVQTLVDGTIDGIYAEGPGVGHYPAMMRPYTRPIACGYYANGDKEAFFINYLAPPTTSP